MNKFTALRQCPLEDTPAAVFFYEHLFSKGFAVPRSERVDKRDWDRQSTAWWYMTYDDELIDDRDRDRQKHSQTETVISPRYSKAEEIF